MAKAASETPLMQQHRAIKQKYPGAVLLFRVGDFYETFGEDAIVASKVLGITLTKRNNGAASEMNWLVFRTMHLIPTCTNWLKQVTVLRYVIN